MTAIEALQRGDLAAALEAVKQDVRTNPQDAKHRVFLFQLFTVSGDWNRAIAQLKVAADLDQECKAMGDAYQHILQCEALRCEVFSGQRTPLMFGEPEAWMAKMFEALRLTGSGQINAAATLRSEALNEAEPSCGTITLRAAPENNSLQSSFQWIADADSRIGPFFEVILQGKYYWVPTMRIQRIAFHDVVDLRDYVWIPAEFTWVGGGELVGMIPVRYPGSESSPDGLIQLARKTEWEECEAETYLGRGQRMLATDEADFAILDIASIEFSVEN